MVEDKLSIDIDHNAVTEILKALSDLSYGSVNIIVQDSKIIQIDRVEKVRLDNRKK